VSRVGLVNSENLIAHSTSDDILFPGSTLEEYLYLNCKITQEKSHTIKQ